MDEEDNELLLDIVEEGTYVEGNSRFNKDVEHKLLKMRSWSLTGVFSIQYSVMLIRGNGVTLRTQKVIQGG